MFEEGVKAIVRVCPAFKFHMLWPIPAVIKLVVG